MKSHQPDFYLASSEGYGMDDPRRCWRIKRLHSASRNDLLLIGIDPPLVGQKFGLGPHDIQKVLVATRHEGASLFPIVKWPVYVHVARLLVDNPEESQELREADFESIAWAELYKSESDARLKGM